MNKWSYHSAWFSLQIPKPNQLSPPSFLHVANAHLAFVDALISLTRLVELINDSLQLFKHKHPVASARVLLAMRPSRLWRWRRRLFPLYAGTRDRWTGAWTRLRALWWWGLWPGLGSIQAGLVRCRISHRRRWLAAPWLRLCTASYIKPQDKINY